MRFSKYNQKTQIETCKFWALICTFLFLSFNIQAQDAARTRLSLSCTQMLDNNGSLEARLLAMIDGRNTPVKNLEISFINTADGEEIELGSAMTNENGIARIPIREMEKFVIDEDSMIVFSAYFDGTELLRSVDDEIFIRRATIEYDAYEEDSVRTISVNAFSTYGKTVPVAEFEIIISVPRMFSDLTIASDYTDEEGKAQFEIPYDIPGDQDGNLDLKISIVDADDYGNLEARFKKNWGVPRVQIAESRRELWSPDAPLWIVITFSVLMIAVWTHFGIIIFNLVRLNKLGDGRDG